MADASIPFRNVEFESEGATLRGRLYLPPGVPTPIPAVVMAHGLSATISMTMDRYAEAICQAGFAALAYDHRNFGFSDGEPRQQINLWLQARGYLDALSYLETLDEIDSARLAVWGDSNSGGEAMAVAAIDKRVKAIVAQVPALGSPPPPPEPDGARFQQIKETLLHGDLTPKEVQGPMPVVSFDPIRDGSSFKALTATRWFIEYGARLGSGWVNDLTRGVSEVPEPWSPATCAPFIDTPLLMVVSHEDEIPGANPDVARAAYESVPGTKQWVDIDGGHFGLLWHPSELFDQASHAQCEFLKSYL